MNKLYGLIGHPVSHSMSPLMHNDAFSQLGISGYYHAFDVSEDQLEEAISAFKVLKIDGFNVTIPHKVAIIDYLDEIDEEAQIVGAVNTVVHSGGRLIGYNTDGRGYLASLLKVLHRPLADCHVLVIGAGGAARGIVTAIANKGVGKLTIANRTVEKAVKIKDDYQKYRNSNFFDIVTLKEAELNIQAFDIIINTTSIGMTPYTNDIPISLKHANKNAVLSDLIYNPLHTKWLQIGKEQGMTIHGGVGMFVMQGALAFEKWTGKKPDIERMTAIVTKQLGG